MVYGAASGYGLQV